MRVLSFRPEEYSSETIEKMKKHGFEAVNVPMVEIVVKDVQVRDADFTIVTSQTSARISAEKSLLRGNVIAIGPKTAQIIRKHGYDVRIPSKFDSETLYSEFRDELRGNKVNLLRSDKGDPVLYKLSEFCDLKEYILYRIEILREKEQKEIVRKVFEREFDALIFTSSMIVEGFMANLNEVFGGTKSISELQNTLVIAIGPPTARKLEKYGIEPLISESYTMDGIIELLKGLQRA